MAGAHAGISGGTLGPARELAAAALITPCLRACSPPTPHSEEVEQAFGPPSTPSPPSRARWVSGCRQSQAVWDRTYALKTPPASRAPNRWGSQEQPQRPRLASTTQSAHTGAAGRVHRVGGDRNTDQGESGQGEDQSARRRWRASPVWWVAPRITSGRRKVRITSIKPAAESQP